MKRILISWILLLSMTVGLVGCGANSSLSATTPTETDPRQEDSLNLLSAMIRQSVDAKAVDQPFTDSMANFSVDLLRHCYSQGNNVVLSPYSLYLILSMTANGARGETLIQMESLLGQEIQQLNPYGLYLQNTAGEELVSANSLWFHESLSIQESFLQDLKNYYSAQVYTTTFDDSTLEAMNDWVRRQTDDRISEALDRMSPNAMLYLLNALTFDGSWETVYTTYDITDQVFYGSVGETTVEMMTSTESIYLDDGQATGFLKEYEGGQYAFLAMLPKEGLTLEDYLSDMTGERLLQTIESGRSTTVVATMPKLHLETTVNAENVLRSMGMVDAFSMAADLSGMNGMQSQSSFSI